MKEVHVTVHVKFERQLKQMFSFDPAPTHLPVIVK